MYMNQMQKDGKGNYHAKKFATRRLSPESILIYNKTRCASRQMYSVLFHTDELITQLIQIICNKDLQQGLSKNHWLKKGRSICNKPLQSNCDCMIYVHIWSSFIIPLTLLMIEIVFDGILMDDKQNQISPWLFLAAMQRFI